MEKFYKMRACIEEIILAQENPEKKELGIDARMKA
jgi:hypothetical protein